MWKGWALRCSVGCLRCFQVACGSAERKACECTSDEWLSENGHSGPVPYEGLALPNPERVACSLHSHVLRCLWCNAAPSWMALLSGYGRVTRMTFKRQLLLLPYPRAVGALRGPAQRLGRRGRGGTWPAGQHDAAAAGGERTGMAGLLPPAAAGTLITVVL